MRLALPSLVVATLIAIIGACSGPALQGNVFRQGDVAFRLGPIPEHWTHLDSVEGDIAAVAFRDREDQITVGAAGRCRRDGDDVPLRSLTQHLYLGFTDRELLSEQEFQLDGRRALRTSMNASLDGVPKHLTFVVLKKDGCVYDFWRIADQPSNPAPFDAFVMGFQTLE
jgi:hypothetical protein